MSPNSSSECEPAVASSLAPASESKINELSDTKKIEMKTVNYTFGDEETFVKSGSE